MWTVEVPISGVDCGGTNIGSTLIVINIKFYKGYGKVKRLGGTVPTRKVLPFH